jgi:nicotinate-nucleotide pyrophosphorylase (carboxylating)
MGPYDALMIRTAGRWRARSGVPGKCRAGHDLAAVTIEVDSEEELERALEAGARRILLDNMDARALGRAVRLARGRAELEASGGLRPGGLRAAAESGVSFLSLGWLTHSAPAADLALEVEPLT